VLALKSNIVETYLDPRLAMRKIGTGIINYQGKCENHEILWNRVRGLETTELKFESTHMLGIKCWLVRA
jgi:hypothetical protein